MLLAIEGFAVIKALFLPYPFLFREQPASQYVSGAFSNMTFVNAQIAPLDFYSGCREVIILSNMCFDLYRNI